MTPEKPNSFLETLLSQVLIHESEQSKLKAIPFLWMKLLTAFTLVIYSVAAYIQNEMLLVGVLVTTLLTIFLCWQLTVAEKISLHTFVTWMSWLAFACFSYILQNGGIDQKGIFWALIIPVVFAMLMGSWATLWSGIFFALHTCVFITRIVLGNELPYAIGDCFRQ